MKRNMSFVVFLLLFLSIGSARAAGWPEIPESDLKLQRLDEFPNASAVVLSREGRVHLSAKSLSSYIDVYTRLKILSPEGVDYGSVSLDSSDYMRVKDLEGRTHLPDGKIIELPEDAKFSKIYSDYYGATLVSCAMPGVTVGSIVEYRYRTYFDSIFLPKPWYFQAEIPTLYSRVTYELPTNVAFVPLTYKTMAQIKLEEKVDRNVTGGTIRYTVRNLPPVPDEASRFPFRDLAYRVLMLPTGKRDSNGMQSPIFDNWKDSVSLVKGAKTWGYGHFLGDAGSAKKLAKKLAGASASDKEKAEVLYRWVRDEVQTEYFGNVWVGDRSADDLLKARKGDLTEKALLLHAMLKGAKIRSDLVWLNPKTRGRIEQNIPNPTQFFRVVVLVELGKSSVFLDPTDRELAFGKLPPSMQGVPCMVLRKKKQEWMKTPVIPPEESLKEATLELNVDVGGRVSGKGRLNFSGNHGWRKLGWKDSEEETKSAWKDWIEAAFPGFDIEGLEVEASVPDQRVGLRWNMRQRDESLDPTEVVINPSAPFTVKTNPYTLPPNRRWTPAQLLFADLERVEVSLSWPEGWVLDEEPMLKELRNSAGSLKTLLTVDETKRKLQLLREFRIDQTEFIGASAYQTLRDLFTTVAAGDAEELILVAE